MEAEKRKRSEKESEERLTKTKKKKEDKEEIATDAEVEEFFAILRRMQVAVKYFGEGWRAAVETEAAAVDKDGNDHDDNRDQEEVKRVVTTATAAREEEVENVNILDLNAAPEGEGHVASA